MNLKTRPYAPFYELSNCEKHKCSESEYKCHSIHYCISIQQFCDGINDCTFGDDELDCGKNKKKINK